MWLWEHGISEHFSPAIHCFWYDTAGWKLLQWKFMALGMLMRSVFRHHRRMMVLTSNQIASRNLAPRNLFTFHGSKEMPSLLCSRDGADNYFICPVLINTKIVFLVLRKMLRECFFKKSKYHSICNNVPITDWSVYGKIWKPPDSWQCRIELSRRKTLKVP